MLKCLYAYCRYVSRVRIDINTNEYILLLRWYTRRYMVFENKNMNQVLRRRDRLEQKQVEL